MGIVGFVAVDLPFLELAPFPNFVRSQMRLQIADLGLISGVDPERLGGVEVVIEQIPNELLVMHDAVLARAVFRGPTFGRHQGAVGNATGGLPNIDRSP